MSNILIFFVDQAEAIEHLAGAVESIATVVALIVGGLWTYLLFVKNRLDKPRAFTAHEVIVNALGASRTLVHVTLKVQNLSPVLMKITSGEVRLIPILPVTDKLTLLLTKNAGGLENGETEIRWPERQVISFDWLNEPREIEPQEVDFFHFDFVVSSPIIKFQVYSYLRNISKPGQNIGWNTTTFHDA